MTIDRGRARGNPPPPGDPNRVGIVEGWENPPETPPHPAWRRAAWCGLRAPRGRRARRRRLAPRATRDRLGRHRSVPGQPGHHPSAGRGRPPRRRARRPGGSAGGRRGRRGAPDDRRRRDDRGDRGAAHRDRPPHGPRGFPVPRRQRPRGPAHRRGDVHDGPVDVATAGRRTPGREPGPPAEGRDDGDP